MTKGRKKAVRAAPTVKRQVRLTSKDATHLVDKNSRAMTKIIELATLAQTEACKGVDQQRLIDRKIEVLKMRLNKRLVKLSKWVDAPEADRLPLPVFRQVPSIYLPKGPRGIFTTRGLPAHVLLENAFILQSQRAAAIQSAEGGARPDLAAALQKRSQYSESAAPEPPSSSHVESDQPATAPLVTKAATFTYDPNTSLPMGWSNSETAESIKESLNLHSLLPPAKVTILPGRKIDTVTGERVTSEEQEMCECGTAYTCHNKSRHLKSIKHIEYTDQKSRLLRLTVPQSTDAEEADG